MSPQPPYDPQKAHDYYERHKHLKGRHPGSEDLSKKGGSTKVVMRHNPQMAKMVSAQKAAQQRVVRLTENLHKLQGALKRAEEALANKRKTAQQNSDGKSTAKQKQSSKKYRDTHKTQLQAKSKQTSPSSSAGSSSSGGGGLSSMSEAELQSRVSRIKGLITNCTQQIRKANSQALSHSEFTVHDGLSAVNTN